MKNGRKTMSVIRIDEIVVELSFIVMSIIYTEK